LASLLKRWASAISPMSLELPSPGLERNHFFEEQRATGERELGPEVVKIPLQRVVEGHAGADETLAMIDQQPQIELRARQRRGRQSLDPGCQ
jgi:hypothetical protein